MMDLKGRQSVLRDASARVAAMHATDPRSAERINLAIGGDGAAMTVEDVEKMLGPKSAAAWLLLRQAKDDFMDAVAEDENEGR